MLDLSQCSSLETIMIRDMKYDIKVPKSCEKIYVSGSKFLDLSQCEKLNYVYIQECTDDKIKSSFSSITKINPLKTIHSHREGVRDFSFLNNYIADNLTTINIDGNSVNHQPNVLFKLDGINILSNLKNLSIKKGKNIMVADFYNSCSLLENIELSNLPNLMLIKNLNVINLKKIIVANTKINNIDFLKNTENLVEINLSNNFITDITPLVTAIGEDGVINYTELDIRNNSLDGYSVANNIDALLKLKAAGLQKVYITGNNFSSNEVNELINGKTIEGKTYVGFGAGNVIN